MLQKCVLVKLVIIYCRALLDISLFCIHTQKHNTNCVLSHSDLNIFICYFRLCLTHITPSTVAIATPQQLLQFSLNLWTTLQDTIKIGSSVEYCLVSFDKIDVPLAVISSDVSKQVMFHENQWWALHIWELSVQCSLKMNFPLYFSALQFKDLWSTKIGTYELSTFKNKIL